MKTRRTGIAGSRSAVSAAVRASDRESSSAISGNGPRRPSPLRSRARNRPCCPRPAGLNAVQPSVVSRQSETTHHSPGSRTPVAHPESRRLAKTNPDGPRREGFLRDHVRKVATPFPAPSPPRSACLLPVHVAGERAGVRGLYRSLRPPHPDPLPPNGVHSESSTECGGEGADSTDYTQWAKALWRSGEESAADLPRPPLPTGGATFGEDMAVGRGLG